MDRGPVHWILGGLAFRLREFEFDEAVSLLILRQLIIYCTGRRVWGVMTREWHQLVDGDTKCLIVSLIELSRSKIRAWILHGLLAEIIIQL